MKQGVQVAIVGGLDEDFTTELAARADIHTTETGDPVDLLFARIQTIDELEVLPRLRGRIKPTGAIWLIHPKGVGGLKHEPIVEAARAADLIDVKTARFSDTHTALKLMVPRASR